MDRSTHDGAEIRPGQRIVHHEAPALLIPGLAAPVVPEGLVVRQPDGLVQLGAEAYEFQPGVQDDFGEAVPSGRCISL